MRSKLGEYLNVSGDPISLREAARRTGIDRFTLRTWLEDAGFHVPSVGHGSKVFILDADLRTALALHMVHRRQPQQDSGGENARLTGTSSKLQHPPIT